jgi:hypothetical protein
MTDQQIEDAVRDGYEIANNLFESVRQTSEGDAVLHSVWIGLTRLLAEAGWTFEDLIKDVAWHAAQATTGAAVQ